MAKGTQNLFFSKVLALDLGLVSLQFPPGSKIARQDVVNLNNGTCAGNDELPECGSRVSSFSPTAPSKVPFEVCPSNLYETFAFNTRSHHELPLMSRSPQPKLHVD